MPQANPPGRPEPITVLVVDDDDDLRKTLVAALKKHGYRVLDADSAERGLQLAEAEPEAVDVALLDIVLPDSWGAQIVPGLKMSHPDIRIVFTSGYAASDPILLAAIDAETTFLHKPFGIDELLEALGQALEGG